MNMFKKGDFLLTVIVIVLALTALAFFKCYSSNDAKEQRIAIVKANGNILYRINLDNIKESRDIALPESSGEIIRVERGRIRFLSADCPDNLCVKTGWLSKKGDMAVCLPNRIIIKIEGMKDN